MKRIRGKDVFSLFHSRIYEQECKVNCAGMGHVLVNPDYHYYSTMDSSAKSRLENQREALVLNTLNAN